MHDFFRNWIKKGFFKNCGSEMKESFDEVRKIGSP
jgi:hypothetical protein